MDFRILGPLEIRQNSRALPCKGAKQRLLLATLLLNANEVISSDRLIEALWGEHPPATAQKALQMHVSQVRRLLDADVLVTRPPGYELRVAAGELDLDRFETAVAAARTAAASERTEEAAALLADALALWRGPPLADLTFEEFLQPEIARLDNLRLAAIEDRVDADLLLGRDAELVPELEALAAEHPLRERIRGQLMLALYRTGRQAEALDVYADTRRRLVEELGLEPSRELQSLQQQVLAQDPELDPRPTDVATVAPSELLGRERELGALTLAIDGALAGRGAVVLIGGEPGIGKSALADTSARYAVAAGARVAVGRCWEAGGAPAFWPWVQALRTLLGEGEAGGLSELAGDDARPDSEGARFRMFESVASLLRAATTDGPVALFLDDLHAADAGSLLLLRFIATDLTQAPLAVVGCYRDTEVGDELAATIAELARQPSGVSVSLSGLDAGATTELLAAVMGEQPPDGLVARVQAETRGNPLFASELGRLFASEGVPDASGRLPVPESVRAAMRRRLLHLSEGCRDVLGLASVFGREFEAGLLARIGAIADDEVAAPLDEAEGARVVGTVPGASERMRFSHILLRDVLYDDLARAKRLELHRSVAEALTAAHAANAGPHLAEIAYHYLEAGPAAAPAAIEYSLLAAERAEQQHGYEDAARLYERALELLRRAGLQDTARTCDVLISFGEALSRAGKSAEAKQTLREAADIADLNGWPSRLARAALAYGGRFAWARGSTDPALVPLLERALAAVGERDPLMRARLLARIAAARRDEPMREPRVALAQEAIDLTRSCEDPVARAYAVEGYWIATDSADRLDEALAIGDELIGLGRQLGDREHEFTGRDFRVNAYWKMADRAGVDLELDLLTGLAEDLRQPAWRWWVQSTNAAVTLMEGDFDEAERLIGETRRSGEQAERWNAHVSERLQLFVLRRAQGRLGELEDLIARSVHEYPSLLRFATAQVHLYAELGDTRRARASFDRILERDLASEHVDGEWLFAIVLLADPCRSLGDTDAASTLYRILLPYADGYAQAPVEASFGSAARALGVLATVLERFDDAERHLDAAAEIEQRMRARPWLAHVRHDLGLMKVARGERGEALPHLAEAAAGYSALGMDSWAARARQLA